jgi:arsenate reductase-like glutaredoxin family protein
VSFIQQSVAKMELDKLTDWCTLRSMSARESYKEYLEDVRQMTAKEIRQALRHQNLYRRPFIKAMEVVLKERGLE